MISTRGRYAVRVMIELAENYEKGSVPLREIAEHQGISLKYLEQVLSLLKNAGLVKGLSYRGGGYVLTKRPEEYTVAEILYAAEGDLAPVACLSPKSKRCEMAGSCKTLEMWSGYYKLTDEYFSAIKLSDFLD